MGILEVLSDVIKYVIIDNELVEAFRMNSQNAKKSFVQHSEDNS